MATKITEDSLTCSICLRRFRKPRALPCLHSYCEECLIEYAPSGTQVIKCPLCQEKVSIPDGDVSKFKLDFRLQSQVEEANRYEQEACIEAEQTSRTRPQKGYPIEERAILVSKLPCLQLSPQRMRDRLTIHFQRKRNGGGDVEGIIYPLNGCPQSAIVVFNDKQTCQTALKSNQFFEEFQTKLTTQLLPPVFKRLEAEIDSFYWNLIPRLTSPQLIDDLSKRFGKTNLQTTAHVLKKVTCSPNQVEELKSTIVNCIVKELGLPVTDESGFETAILIKDIPFLTNDTQQLREELIKHLEMEVIQLQTLISPLQGNAREAMALFQSDKDICAYLNNSHRCFYGGSLIVSRLPHFFKILKVSFDDVFATLTRNFDRDLFRAKLQSSCNEDVIIGDNDLTCSAEQLVIAKNVMLEMIGLSRQSLLQISEAAASVANSAHRLEGAGLAVILPRPKRPTDRHRLLLTGIPEGTKEDMMLLFIEGRTKIEEDPEVMFGEIPGTAMLRYSVELQDIEKVIDNFKKKPLQKQIVSAFCVDYPDCILVQNLTPSITEDTVELYFESERKSGGGMVREIQMDEKKKRAIVFFEDWRVVNRVMRRKHTLSRTQLHVSAYFDNLGVIVASDRPISHIPDPIVVQIDPAVAEFVLDAGSSHRARVDSVVLDEKGRLKWPGKGQINLVEIIPVTSGSDPSCWVDWSSRVKSRLFDIMNEFKSDNILVDEDLWNDVCNKLQGLNLGNVRPQLKSDQATIILRGPCAEVENTMTRLACVVKDLEAEAERARQIAQQIVRKVVKLNEEKFKHLFLCNIKEELDKKWQIDVRIMQSGNPNEIIFEGMRSESAEAVLDMYTQLDNLVKHDFEFSPNKVRFVKHVQDKIHEILNSRNIHAAIAIGIDSNKMTITGAADKDTRLAYHFIQNDIGEASVAIQNQDTVNILQAPKGKTILAEVNKSRILAAVNPDKCSIELTGFKADVQQASNIIQDFIEKNVILQEHIPVMVDFDSFSARDDFGSFRGATSMDFSSPGPSFSMPQPATTSLVSPVSRDTISTKEKKTITLKRGDIAAENAFEDEMQGLLQGTTGAYAPTRRLKSQTGYKNTSRTATKYWGGHGRPGCDPPLSIQIGHITVHLQQGDLTQENTDAIVNSAGYDLSLNGPVSKAIVKAGGKEIARECKKLVDKGHKNINKGAVKTTAGRLPCRCIIHVVTPHTGSQLKSVMLEALQLAENDGMRSIAFPALGTGRVGANAATSASVLLDAIGEFATYPGQKSLQLIKLTIFQAAMLPDYTEAMRAKANTSYKPQKRVLRKGYEQTSFNLPTNWIPMTGQNSVTVPLTQGSQEFVQVQTAFQNSLRRVPVIHKIERVQVLDLYKSYVAKMEHIETSLPAGIQAERTLFHGTTHDTCDKVNRYGFNRSYCVKNGTAHGKGVYFAQDASYSDGYAQPSGPNHYKHMYMCNVLTGEYIQGNAFMVSPPPKTNSPNEMYDCVVDNVRNPGVFVVFCDAQAYPEYLIIYS